MHEEAAVAREQGALILRGTVDEREIVRRAIVEHIEAEQAQVTNELAEVAIRDKAANVSPLQRLVAMQVERRGDPVHCQVAFRLQAVSKINRHAIRHDKVDLRMRDAARFDHVFDRGLLAQNALDDSAITRVPKKIIESAEKLQADAEGVGRRGLHRDRSKSR